MKVSLRKTVLTLSLSLAVIVCFSANAFSAKYGVYTNVSVNVPGSVHSIANKVESALNANGWDVIGSFNVAVPAGDMQKGIVIVATNHVYNRYMVANGVNPVAAFGIPLRVEVFTTPNQGTVVSMVNLPAISRTFSGNSYVNYAVEVGGSIKGIIRNAVGGTASDENYGPIRSGRFPGGIGGGSFPGSVDSVQNYSGSSDSNLAGVAKLVMQGIKHNTGHWHLAYKINDPQDGFIEFGIYKNNVTRESISIDSGARATASYKYPGIDHASAYPIEILVYRNGQYTDVSVLGEMWRMKYYFADAGMWAFMTHMGMPGAIEGSIKKMILYGLAY